MGPYLVDTQGRTLYVYTKDQANQSICYNSCVVKWPPLLLCNTQGFRASNINIQLLGYTQRQDGSQQVTFNGFPLYYYYKDATPGMIAGQTVDAAWYVISPTGQPHGVVISCFSSHGLENVILI